MTEVPRITGDAVEDNNVRAEWALEVLQQWSDLHYGPADRTLTDEDTFSQNLSDLMCNLMHLAEREHPDVQMFESCVERGRRHYDEETGEADEQRKTEG